MRAQPPRPNTNLNIESPGVHMLSWAVTFLVIAIIAALLGFTGIAGTAATIAKALFFIFLVLFVVFLVMGRRRPPV